MRERRVDIISDTHGHLSPRLLQELQGADLIVHAGDIVSNADYDTLLTIAPVKACLGNNDYRDQFGAQVPLENRFYYEGVFFDIKHIKARGIKSPASFFDVMHSKTQDQDMDNVTAPRIQVFGHTHRSEIIKTSDGYEINPGSATWPRDGKDPSMARLWIRDGVIEAPQIVYLSS